MEEVTRKIGENRGETVSSRGDRIIALLNSKQLWFPAKDFLAQIKPVNMPALLEEGQKSLHL